MNRNLKQTIIALTRLINQAHEANPYARNLLLKHIAKKLTKNENEALVSSLKAMALMTKANVSTVRNPEKFRPNNSDEWIKYTSNEVVEVIKIFDPSFDETSFVTKKDYLIANLYLKQLGNFAIPQAIIDKIKKSRLKDFRFDVSADRERSMRKVDQRILWRGIGGISKNLMFGLLEGGTWDMSRIVSTSLRKSTAAEFARRNGSIQVIFKLRNPLNKGYVADNLSAFKGEMEVIFSGKVRINSWTLDAAGTTSYEAAGESKFFGLYTPREKQSTNSRLYFSSKDNHIKFSYNDHENEKVLIKGNPVDQISDLFYGEGKYKTKIPVAMDNLAHFDIDDSTIILNVNATIL